MNFLSATAARYATFNKLTTTNGNYITQQRNQENQIRSLQTEMWNQKVAAAERTTEYRGTINGGGHSYTHTRKIDSKMAYRS